MRKRLEASYQIDVNSDAKKDFCAYVNEKLRQVWSLTTVDDI